MTAHRLRQPASGLTRERTPTRPTLRVVASMWRNVTRSPTPSRRRPHLNPVATPSATFFAFHASALKARVRDDRQRPPAPADHPNRPNSPPTGVGS
eukprot:138626-Chlamydomonas_euryale.AAC.7